MLRATDLAHLILGRALKPGAIAVDATVGNGHDTAAMAAMVGPTGHVYGFDIQGIALRVAAERLRAMPQVTLFHAGHEEMAARLPASAQHQLGAVMFNLGYLPGAAKDIVTRTATTLQALDQAMQHLSVGGIIAVVTYPGHTEGAQEAVTVRRLAERLPAAFAASTFQRANSVVAAPELVVIERLRSA